jgi:hypothetical protein
MQFQRSNKQSFWQGNNVDQKAEMEDVSRIES